MRMTLSASGCGAVCEVAPAGSCNAIGAKHTVYYKRGTRFAKALRTGGTASQDAVARTVVALLGTNASVRFVEAA